MKKKVVIILILLCLCFCFSVATYARYRYNNVWNYYLESQGFYFTSDHLSNNQANTDTFWDGGHVPFNLKNFSNSDLISDKDIAYQVSCAVLEGDETCTLNGTNRSTITGVLSKISKCIDDEEEEVEDTNKTECELAGYTWQKSLVTNQLYFDVVSDSEITSVDVRITARSTSPFQKTITGVFHLTRGDAPSGAIDFQVNHYAAYDELIVSNSYNSSKDVSVSFDTSKRIVDVTNNMTVLSSDANQYVESFSFSIAGMSNEKFIFYSKDGLEVFSDITVSEMTP
jgi:hypothetical protein